ncbi:hypothetical protein BDZ89DRAFT_114139 [Hymenopellis radicata]|nr:hypothetical protein BDZ89DRAFT_114139 [Hymenopellis radicata]
MANAFHYPVSYSTVCRSVRPDYPLAHALSGAPDAIVVWTRSQGLPKTQKVRFSMPIILRLILFAVFLMADTLLQREGVLLPAMSKEEISCTVVRALESQPSMGCVRVLYDVV